VFWSEADRCGIQGNRNYWLLQMYILVVYLSRVLWDFGANSCSQYCYKCSNNFVRSECYTVPRRTTSAVTSYLLPCKFFRQTLKGVWNKHVNILSNLFGYTKQVSKNRDIFRHEPLEYKSQMFKKAPSEWTSDSWGDGAKIPPNFN